MFWWHLFGQQDEDRRRVWFLDGFQKLGGSLRGGVVKAIDQDHLASRLGWSSRGRNDHRVSLIDPKGGSLRLEHHEIGVFFTSSQRPVSLAVDIGPDELARHARCSSTSTRPSRSEKQVGVDRLLHRCAQLFHDAWLANDIIERITHLQPQPIRKHRVDTLADLVDAAIGIDHHPPNRIGGRQHAVGVDNLLA